MQIFMSKLGKELKWFLQQKVYVILVALTAILSYGFAITHYAIGIDDTAVELYLEDGLEVVMGRWTVFLVNKLFHLSQFAPFMLELVGVLLFLLGITLFCILIRRILGDRIDIYGYTFFACIFLSNPIISEIYVYYYHDGSDLAYVLTGMALLCFLEALDKQTFRKSWSFYVWSMLFAWMAAGCYESFLILYILGILILLFLGGMMGRYQLSVAYVCKQLGVGAFLCVGVVGLRSVMISLLTAVFRLQEVQGMLPVRSLSEMLVLFKDSEGLRVLLMLMKRFWLVYHVNAVVYLPVTVFEFSTLFMFALSIYLAVKKKNVWYPVLFGGMMFATFLLTVAEARLTSYRSCQFLPFFAALGCLLFYGTICGKEQKRAAHRWRRYLACMLAVILIYNQAEMMNRFFYVDFRKYEDTRERMLRIAFDIESEYGTEMPVVFVGHYSTPEAFSEDFYVSMFSWQYRLIARITDPVDEHLKEKYQSWGRYSYVGEALNPLILWGLDAFDGTNRELIRFLEMHGHTFHTVQDPDVIARAKAIGDDMPAWPAEGAISMQDGYVLVHINDQ